MKINAPTIPGPSPNSLIWSGTIYSRHDEAGPRGYVLPHRIYRGAAFGSDTGYSSLGDAVRAAKHLTAGEDPTAVAVVREGARFALYQAWSRVQFKDGQFSRPSQIDLGRYNVGLGYREIKQTAFAHDALRALVDGSYVKFVGEW